MNKELDEALFRHPPRIQGRVGQAEPGQGHDGKWFFELFMTFIGVENNDNSSLGLFGPFDTEKLAQDELKIAVKFVCDKIEMDAVGKTSGKYYDMKTNQIRPWREN